MLEYTKHSVTTETEMPYFRSFEKQVLPLLVKRGTAVLGMKSMASGQILQSKTVNPTKCVFMNKPKITVFSNEKQIIRKL